MNETQHLQSLIIAKGCTHLVLDLDSTIASIHLPWDEGYRMLDVALADYGEPSFRHAIMHENRVFGRVFNEYLDVHPQALPIILKWARDFETLSSGYTPYPDLIETLSVFAASGGQLSLWTSNVRATARDVLSSVGILEHFSAIVTREDVKYLKPDPEGWQHIDDGRSLSEYLFIGDSTNDRHAAEAIGIDYFNISYFKDKK